MGGLPDKPPVFSAPVTFPYVIVDWWDSKPCPPKILPWLVQIVIKYLNLGKQIECGCLGAHGRTGTFLACLVGKVEGLPPKKAIQVVRERLCSKAVETMAQVEQVYTFLGSTVEQANKDFEHKKETKKSNTFADGAYWDNAMSMWSDDPTYPQASKIHNEETSEAKKIAGVTDAEWLAWYEQEYGVRVASAP